MIRHRSGRRAVPFRALLIILAANVGGIARADIPPPRPKPPPPPEGPAAGNVRGLQLQRILTGSFIGRWETIIRACEGACATPRVVDCVVTGANGVRIRGGDIAAVLTAGQIAAGKPITLTLEHCALPQIELSAGG
ncbi:hypothetical protein [Bosea sp. 117]|uniref:hypothetical protein n=1 Tax=Bosea sp. 117 TaxID=1125973 RepID=UPI000494386A|nr:hypothetical protein [Bosea sp. 117]